MQSPAASAASKAAITAEIGLRSAQNRRRWGGGEAIAAIDGVEHHVGPGDLLFFPPRVFHSVTALSERIKVLVIYSPPYGENPAQVIRV